MKVRKAVVTAAGWGTRFLPVTKAQPKEMLPLVDKPIIQYAVEEAVTAGLKQVVMVTAQGKRAIEDYFDRSFELEYLLQQRGETALWEQVRRLSNMADIAYVRQKEQLGLGNAVLVTQAVVGEEPFALFLPDDVFVGNGPVIGQLIEAHGELGGCVLAVQRVKKEEVGRYGIIAPKQIGPRLYQVLDLVEKPSPQQAPSDLAIVGRYVLEPKIFAALEATPPGRGQEVQLTDGLRQLLPREKIYAVEYEGVRYDAGTPMSWLKATVALALDHPELGAELRGYLRTLI
ncbi:MAG TPA: UTP--glucose-1-phosphate uridylyltransferase GalU [Dehalococcoidia bacterium]|nr:UTP--glucose-1-phosphate uridylyltransferase GalU [Dehalococcoidia bacterium]